MKPSLSASHARLAALVGIVALTSGCKGPPPEQVRLELPDQVLSTDPTRAVVHLRRAGSSSVSTEKMDFTVTPPDVASVTPDGTLTCRKAGDAKLVVSVQGVKDDETLRCRLVDRLDVTGVELLDVTKPPVTVQAHALTKQGTELSDVPVTLSSDSPRILSTSGTTLTPLSVGETSITARAGAKAQKFPVRIVRTMSAEALPLEGGRRIYYSLPEGKYEVEVTLPAEKDLSVEWRGAPYCSYKGHAKVHRATCVLQAKGGAVVDNPAYVMTADTAVTGAGVVVREVP